MIFVGYACGCAIGPEKPQNNGWHGGKRMLRRGRDEIMGEYELKTEWVPIVTVEKTVTMGETSTRTAADITGFDMGDAMKLRRAFLKTTEEGDDAES